MCCGCPSKRCPDRRAHRNCSRRGGVQGGTVVLEVQVPSRSLDHSASWVRVLSRCAQSSTMILRIQYASHQHISCVHAVNVSHRAWWLQTSPRLQNLFTALVFCVPKEKLLWSWWFASPSCTMSSHHITQLTDFTEYTCDRMPARAGSWNSPNAPLRSGRLCLAILANTPRVQVMSPNHSSMT